jgi:predicted alpha/beta superfamily hydrolase
MCQYQRASARPRPRARRPSTGFALAVLLATGNLAARAQPASRPVEIGEAFTIHSEILAEERQILVAKPSSYDASVQQYAVLYVLDGEEHFAHIASLVSFLSSNEFIPPLRMVAIANTDRNRDFLTAPVAGQGQPLETTAGGADEFMRFLDTELIPWVDRDFRSNDFRLLFGHSAGGFFALYSLLRFREPFDAYIAASPSVWWNDEELLRILAADAPRRAYGGKTLFMSLGDEGADAKSQLGRLADQLGDTADRGLRWTYRVWEFRLVDRGLVLYANGSPNELVMQGQLAYTLPGLLLFEFGMNRETGAATMRVRTSATEWEATERLD